MFKRKSHDPEVKAAQEVRDDLLVELEHAVSEVDRLQDELLAEYEAAEEQRKRNGGRQWS